MAPKQATPGHRLWLTAPALLLVTLPVLADKTDLIYMRNGDRITGEIKGLSRGQLELSTDSLGTIQIEWKDIARVSSRELFVVELEDGTRFDGTLAETEVDGQLLLRREGEFMALEMQRVVWVDTLKLDAVRIRRWDGSVSLGFDATKANNDVSLSAGFDARRRAETFLLNFNGSWYSRSQDGAEDTLRATLGGIYRGLLERRWYWAALGNFERNDELGIDLRTAVGAGYGRFLQQSGRSLWSMTGGLVLVNEQRAGDEDAENNIEGLLNTAYEFFTYDTPKTSLTTSLTLFPSITQSGRVRSDVDFSLRRELITDLFIEVRLYGSWDNEPPVEGERSDYGIVTSLGYTF